ncbi:putative CDP-alcohol phosphatidyltransferase class-I family protein 2 [Phytophthora cinnamomi]|uniref:putative CDP-alcohol phosphatidyltransferase class-I family protein 2 n=1 Tax=Phytophthora cinnamomi TaxID=4785 RepID=UPI00355ABE73|nr:putative CDP-alcohol phosphatidyltransferase class-I family protein 2 [Phytophthora cinnamomi]
MASAAEQRFLQWLRDNGATFPKLQWPATTPNGLRGVVSTGAIAAGEPMLSIPRRLLISEDLCWRDPQLRHVFQDNRDVFTRDDPVLALFLVRELLLEERSFFHPYLAILPYPESVQDWTQDELRELHDERLEDAAARRSSEIDVYYRRVMARLQSKYPGEFPEELYTLDRFKFAWKTIQARTFGRRLPWTALVPFADCLNHTNVATKYDFDVDDNDMFRLYPSASTTFAEGAEVFNSYGRRPNFQLLLDYGFALTDNEWDYVDVEISKDRVGPRGRRLRFMKRVIRVDRQSSLDEVFPPGLLSGLADPLPDEEQSETAAEVSELAALMR